MTDLRPCPVRFQERLWSRDELARLALLWRTELVGRLDPMPPLTAMVMANRPESIALFFALTSLPAPLVLLGEDPRAWRSSPPLPPGTPLVLSGASEDLAGAALAIGCPPVVLTCNPSPARVSLAPRPFLASAGLVGFTSGSTGLPKPVYRSMASALQHARIVAEILELRTGDGVVGALPLSVLYGLGDALLLATILGGELGLLERFDHRSVLRLFASGRYRYFPATPLMIDVLARCPMAGPAPTAPAWVKVAGGPMPAAIFETFRDRYGAPPRPAYGTSETGILTAEIGAPAEVRAGGVGHPVPDVRIAIGDVPERSVSPGVPGRVWVATPRRMEGYGFPPDLEPRQEQGDWWPTRDLGIVDVTGRLTLLGRLDDAFKTPAGQLVNPAEVTAVLERCPGVTEAVVVAIPGATGSLVGAVASGGTGVDTAGLRQHAARHLPAWAQPEVVVLVDRLPRLPGGKTDREACLGLLLDAVAPPGTRSRSS